MTVGGSKHETITGKSPDESALVVRSSEDADAVRIDFEEGTTVEASFVGPNDGYPPVAVVPIEAPGISGTIYAITDNGDVLWSQPFTVTEIVNPGG